MYRLRPLLLEVVYVYRVQSLRRLLPLRGRLRILTMNYQWRTPAEIAAEYNRTQRTVQRWCKDGTLREFGFLVVRTKHTWWILPAAASIVSTT